MTDIDLVPKPVNWKANLAVLCICQFINTMGFYFCLPFFPLYMKQNLLVDAADVPFWSGIFFSTAPAAMMIVAPIWGMVGDRYGRKKVLVLVTFLDGVAIFMMGVVSNIWGIIAFRIMQGSFSGSLPASQVLVTNNTPHRRQGFAIGLLMGSVSAGNAAGSFVGGKFAKYYGAAGTFKIGGLLLVFATVLAFIIVRENFMPPAPAPAPTESARLRRRQDRINNVKTMLPMLLAIIYICFFQIYDTPILSLYVNELYRSGTALAGMAEETIVGEVYSLTGNFSALGIVTAVLGSTVVGLILDRKPPPWVWCVLALAGAAGALWIRLDPTFMGLGIGRSLFFFVISGFASIVVVVFSRTAPGSKRSLALGWAFTARSLGWALAPVVGSFAASRMGYMGAYTLLGVLCLGLAPTLVFLERRYRPAFRHEEGAEIL